MKKFAPLFTMLILISACASVSVSIQYDEETDFTRYQTFRFQRPQTRPNAPGRANPLLSREVLNEIRPVMESKGFREVSEGEKPDLLVIFYASVQNRRDWSPPTYRVGRWGRVHRTSPGHVYHYKEGTLVIDMVDRERQELVWQGVGNGILSRDNPTEKFREAVEKVLEDFPPVQ